MRAEHGQRKRAKRAIFTYILDTKRPTRTVTGANIHTRTHTNAMTNIHTGQTCSVCNTNNYDEMREVRKRQEEYWR